MRISFEVNGKIVLAVVAIGALSAGSFYAGEYHQAHKPQVISDSEKAESGPHGPWEKYRVLTIPSGITEEAWCKAHPSTNWQVSESDHSAKVVDAYGGAIDRNNGSCDEHGQVFENYTAPTK